MFYRENSPIHDFVTEFVPGFFGVIFGLALATVLVLQACYLAFDPPMCRARGAKMGIEVSWGFWEGCMASLSGQWLPWSEIVPVERGGKIVFVPRPHPVVKIEK